MYEQDPDEPRGYENFSSNEETGVSVEREKRHRKTPERYGNWTRKVSVMSNSATLGEVAMALFDLSQKSPLIHGG